MIKIIDDKSYVFTLIKLIEHTENFELKRLKAELDNQKNEKENGGGYEDNQTINIRFIDEHAEDGSDNGENDS